MSFLTGNGAENALSCFLKIKYDFIFHWFSEQKKREKEKEKRQWRKLSFKHKIFKEQSYFVVCYLPLVSEGPNTLAMNKEKIIMIMVQVNRSLGRWLFLSSIWAFIFYDFSKNPADNSAAKVW